MGGLRVAVVGATGAVGRELLGILEERKFPVRELVPFASPRSVGKPVQFHGTSVACRMLEKKCFDGIDMAFFDASDAVSKEWVPAAVGNGAWVIDNSGTFRMEVDIPLVVPEVNGALLERPKGRIVSGPNCSTVQLVVALKPLLDRWGLKRVTVSTYQSTSGAGAAAMEELSAQTMAVFNGKEVAPKAFAHRIAFNCIPQIGSFQDDGVTSEERKIMQETRKILGLPGLRISATAVRVPTYSGHGESVNVECERPVTPEEAREALRAQPGVVVQDEPSNQIYPMNITASAQDGVFVGRIRRDSSVENGAGLCFWVVADNLRKGAALNAVQAGELLIRNAR